MVQPKLLSTVTHAPVHTQVAGPASGSWFLSVRADDELVDDYTPQCNVTPQENHEENHRRRRSQPAVAAYIFHCKHTYTHPLAHTQPHTRIHTSLLHDMTMVVAGNCTQSPRGRKFPVRLLERTTSIISVWPHFPQKGSSLSPPPLEGTGRTTRANTHTRTHTI